MDRRLHVLLLQIRDVVANIEGFVADKTRADLDGDLKLELALTMSIVILGELCARIEKRSPQFVEAHPEIPWNAIRGFRNRIAHNYFSIENDVVRETATQSVPAVAHVVSALVADLGELP